MSIYLSGILQGKAYRILQNNLTEALLPFNISIPEWKILGLLQIEKGLKITTIADILDVESPLVTRLINTLEKNELVQKEQNKKDKRIMTIVSTHKGKKLIQDSDSAVRNALGILLKGISAEEMEIYKKVLETIVENGQIGSYNKKYIVE